MAAKKSRSAAAEEVEQFQREQVVLAIEKLQELQDKLQKINEEADEKILAIEDRYNEIREPVYIRRNEIIRSIPDFWLKVFLNHPTLGIMLMAEDKKIFRYLDSLEVKDYTYPRHGYCITFNFKANPYFKNDKLTKTIKYTLEGTLKSFGTTIKWKEGKAPVEIKGDRPPLPLESFFSWFGYPQKDRPEVDNDMVAEIIKEDLWPNAVDYLNNEDEDEEFDEDEDDEDEEDDEGEGDGDEDDSGKKDA